jgi:hypothetical protein
VNLVSATRRCVPGKNNTDHALFDLNRCTEFEFRFVGATFDGSEFRFVLVLVVVHRFPLAIRELHSPIAVGQVHPKSSAALKASASLVALGRQQWQKNHFPLLLHPAFALQFFCHRIPTISANVVFPAFN